MPEAARPLSDTPSHLRFHTRSTHLGPAFGSDWFGLRAERFARFFGTPLFLIGQSALVAGWIVLNAASVVSFDPYPFILLNLAFSLQAAYAAPLILLAQTRQADRDKATAENDALHREEISRDAAARQASAGQQLELLVTLMERNTELTDLTHQLSERIDALTREIHAKVSQLPGAGA